MKTLRFTVIALLAALTLASCDSFRPIVLTNTTSYYYFLHVGFKDKAGNDLTAQFAADRFKSTPGNVWYGEIDTLKYTLDIVPGDPSVATDAKYFYLPPMRVSGMEASGWETKRPSVTMTKFDEQLFMIAPLSDGSFEDGGDWYMDFHYSMSTAQGRMQEGLTYKFSCPAVFGDDAVHDIKTTWSKGEDKSYLESYPKCMSVEIDGVRLTPKLGTTFINGDGSAYISYFVDVVVDR